MSSSYGRMYHVDILVIRRGKKKHSYNEFSGLGDIVAKSRAEKKKVSEIPEINKYISKRNLKKYGKLIPRECFSGEDHGYYVFRIYF